MIGDDGLLVTNKGEQKRGMEENGEAPHNELYTLTNEERVRYLGAVVTFMELPEELPETISVDKTGYSPELAEIVGRSYLGTHVIIASLGQQHAPLKNTRYSFLEKLVDNVLNKDIVKTIVEHETLLGSVEIRNLKDKTGFIGGLEALDSQRYDFPQESKNEEGDKEPGKTWKDLRSHLSLDTPTKTIAKLRKIQQSIKGLTGKGVETQLLSEEGLDGLVSLYQDAAAINTLYGANAVTFLDAKEVKASVKLDSPFKFNGENICAYVLPGEMPLIIYEGKRPRGAKKTKNSAVLLNHVSEEAEVLDRLMAYGHLRWESSMAKDWMHNIALSSFIKAGVKEEQFKVAVSNTMTFYKFLADSTVKEELDPRWFRLRNILYPTKGTQSHKMEREFQSLDMDLKWKLVTLTTQEPLVTELFEKLSPPEVIENPYSEELMPYIDKAGEMLLRIKDEDVNMGNPET